MKNLFFVVLATLTCGSLHSQEGWINEPLDSVEFCGKKFNVPEGCQAYKKDHINGGSAFDMSWLRIPEQFTINTATSRSAEFIKLMGGKVVEKQIKCYLLGNKAKGSVATFQPDQRSFKFLFSVIGKVGKDPVQVLLYLNKFPETDDDLPVFVRQIVRL